MRHKYLKSKEIVSEKVEGDEVEEEEEAEEEEEKEPSEMKFAFDTDTTTIEYPMMQPEERYLEPPEKSDNEETADGESAEEETSLTVQRELKGFEHLSLHPNGPAVYDKEEKEMENNRMN